LFGKFLLFQWCYWNWMFDYVSTTSTYFSKFRCCLHP
jgi:hypothetical protein